MNIMLRTLGLLVGLLFTVSAMAAAVIESVTGSVRAGATATTATAVAVGKRVEAGSTIVTGPKSQVIMRFDDGQAMVLHEDTEFKIATYVFSEKEPAKDSFVFDLLRGAARSVTAALTRRNASAYAMRTSSATIGIRGTDYMVAVYNPAVVSVISGLTTVTNAAGVVSVAAGGLVSVAGPGVLAAATTLGALPAGVASSFSSLGSVAVTGGAAAGAGAGSGTGAAGAGGASGAGVGGLGAGGLAAGAAAAAAIVGATSQTQATSGTTGTTGTTGTN